MKKKWNKRLHTPSLYLCTNVTGCIATPSLLLIAFLMPHCPVTFVQRYRDGVCSLLFHLFFIICHPYIPLHLEETIFYTCFTDFWLCQCTYHIGAKRDFYYTCNYHFLLHYWPSLMIPPFPCSRFFPVMQHAGIELGPHRYDATLLTSTLCYTRSHKPRAVHTIINTRVRGRRRRGTLSQNGVVHC